MANTILKLTAAFALLLIGGCSELSDIPRHVCGNGIVESGEDCDSRKAGSCVSCRFTCSKGAQAEGCPSGWACGSDNICREPSGEYETFVGSVASFATNLQRGNFDGAGGDELLLRGDQSFVYHFDNTRQPKRTFEISTTQSFGARHTCTVLRVNGDIRDDIVLATEDGNLDILLGQEVGPPFPFSHARPLPWANARAFAGRANASDPRRELLLLADKTLYRRPDPIFEFSGLFELEVSAANLARQIAIGNIDGKGCEEVGLATAGDTRVLVSELCNEQEGPKSSWVLLPPGVRVTAGAMFAEIDGNAYPDLLVQTGKNVQLEDFESDVAITYVAYGVGDGTFHSTREALPAQNGDGRFSAAPLRTEFGTQILATGHLNGDNLSDFIGGSGLIILSTPPAQVEEDASCTDLPGWRCLYVPTNSYWDAAVIADFNHDDIPDIVGSDSSLRRIDFMTGAGNGLFNLSTIALPGFMQATAPVVGDFDGDRISDWAFAYKVRARDDNASLGILFGKPSGAPVQISELGDIGREPQLAAGASSTMTFDAFSDLLVLSGEDEKQQVANFEGRSDRRLYSPLSISSLDADGKLRRDSAIALLSGHFSGSPSEEIAVLGRNEESELLLHHLPLREGIATAATELNLDPLSAIFWAATRFDVEPDGRDELVHFGYPEPTQLSIARLNADNWVFDAPISVANATNLRSLQLVADFDEDGFSDILALDAGIEHAELVLFRTNGSPSIDFTAPVFLAIASGGVPLAMRELEADSDSAPELAIILRDEQAFLPVRLGIFDLNTSDWMLRPKLEPAALPESFQQFAAPGTIEVDDLEEEFAPFDAFIGLVAGDFDGNGLDDIAVSGLELTILFAKARNEGANAE